VAAARVKLFTPRILLTRLSNRLSLLTNGARDLPTRQQTLRDAIAWSYDLLDTGEQALFARLGVFMGGCSLEAAEAVCGSSGAGATDPTPHPQRQAPVLDGLASLIDKSLLRCEEASDGEPRFTMLELVREYALERLAASGCEDQARRQHTTFFLTMIERAQGELNVSERGPRLARDHDNLRHALAWTIDHDEMELAGRLCVALSGFWWTHGHLSEGRRWLAMVLANSSSLPATLRAQAFNPAGMLAYMQGDYEPACACWEDGLAIARAAKDEQEITQGLFLLGLAFLEVRGDFAAARSFWETCLASYRVLDDKPEIASTILMLGNLALALGHEEEAVAHYMESQALNRELGHTWGVAVTLINLGYVALHQDDWARAERLAKESLTLLRGLGDTWGIPECLGVLAGAAGAIQQPARAARLFGAIELLLNVTGGQLEPTVRAEYDRNLAVARAQLDEATFAAAWAEGRMFSLEQAMAYALDDGV
jgi:tetratricopeptide (TPR) repeat protein